MQECAKNEVIVETKSNVEKADDSAENNPALWKWSGSLDELTNRCAALGASAPAPCVFPKSNHSHFRLVYAKSSDTDFMNGFIHCIPLVTRRATCDNHFRFADV